MSMVVVQSPEPEDESQAVVKRGNGKTHEEKVNRMHRDREIAQLELEIKAEHARAEIAVQHANMREGRAKKVLDAYDAQESKRAPQLQIDQTPIFWVLLGIAVSVFLGTALLTADGTIGASASALFAVPWFGYLLFTVFEMATLGFMLMYYIRGSRVDIITGIREKSSQWFVAMVFSAAFTVALSAYHVMDLYEYDFNSIDLWVGIGIRAVASVFFVLISKGIAGVLFAKALDLNQIARIGATHTEEAS